MNKKVGILTYHNAYNFGAVLQTYALNYYINSLTNNNCETIDYQCDSIINSYKLFNRKNFKTLIKSFINLSSNITKQRKFKKFIKENVILSNEKYNKNNIFHTNEIYNVFIFGSDQVWNYELNNDWNYYLKFVNENNKRTSYAASLGNIEILEKYKKNLENELNKFSLISVREQSAKEKLKSDLKLNASVVLDPVFLLNQHEWNKFIKKDNRNKKYILVYLLHEKDIYQIANRLKKLTKYNVYFITEGFDIKMKGKRVSNAGIEEFLTLIRNSQYVITDSFHGTALSIIFRKNLKVVLKKKHRYLNDRLVSVLKRFDIKDCIVDLESKDEDLIAKTSYNEKNVEEIINDSKKYIRKILDLN